ncbi:MAG: hypothetical protein FI688_02175 [SAR202 cluster bacterium]|nr:hypothetical protein [SAR202 cluster bacterium]
MSIQETIAFIRDIVLIVSISTLCLYVIFLLRKINIVLDSLKNISKNIENISSSVAEQSINGSAIMKIVRFITGTKQNSDED